jgi:hypothetical protein
MFNNLFAASRTNYQQLPTTHRAVQRTSASIEMSRDLIHMLVSSSRVRTYNNSAGAPMMNSTNSHQNVAMNLLHMLYSGLLAY